MTSRRISVIANFATTVVKLIDETGAAMSEAKNWQFEPEEYIKQGEPGKIEKSETWNVRKC